MASAIRGFAAAWTATGFLLLALASPAAVRGQSAGSRLCLRGAPLPGCRGFLRLELRGGGSMAESPRDVYVVERGPGGDLVPVDTTQWLPVGDWIGVELGYELNAGERWAWGGSLAVETGNETTRFLLRGRARRWLTSRLYAEAIPGAFWQRRDLSYRADDGLEDAVGFSAEARLGLAGLLFVGARYDVLHAGRLLVPLETSGLHYFDPGGTSGAFSIGGGLEGRTAILASTATLLVGLVVALAWGGPIA